jgi:hypothetical protein
MAIARIAFIALIAIRIRRLRGERIIAAFGAVRMMPAATDRRMNQQRGSHQTGKHGTHE